MTPSRTETGIRGAGVRALLRFAIFLLLLPAVPLIAYGQWDWPMAWAYFTTFFVSTVGGRLIVLRRNPDLLVERGRATAAADAKSWDRLLVPLVALLGPVVTGTVAGLDHRHGWSLPLPLWLQLTALGVVILGFFLGNWAMVVNRFFSSVVRIQHDRDHTVVTAGPYRWVRHPSYLGGIAAYLVTPILLGSLWALIPAGLTCAGIVVRTTMEDRTLIAELPGYAAYAGRTRYRLFPGIW